MVVSDKGPDDIRVNVGISVSRVGSAAQPKIMKQVALDGEQDHA